MTPIEAGYFTAACVFAGSLVRPIGGALADRIGGIRTLLVMYVLASIFIAIVSFGAASPWVALLWFILGMGSLGVGNGAVFQLVPQRFRKEIGVMTGLVGMAGGVGGFYLAASLGYIKGQTGDYQLGLLIFAGLCFVALVGLSKVKTRWRTTWGAVAISGARV
jgi:NNP family nitrate/nitrite transporter-like MFS transporter